MFPASTALVPFALSGSEEATENWLGATAFNFGWTVVLLAFLEAKTSKARPRLRLLPQPRQPRVHKGRRQFRRNPLLAGQSGAKGTSLLEVRQIPTSTPLSKKIESPSPRWPVWGSLSSPRLHACLTTQYKPLREIKTPHQETLLERFARYSRLVL
jgi:hypothetical protein